MIYSSSGLKSGSEGMFFDGDGEGRSVSSGLDAAPFRQLWCTLPSDDGRGYRRRGRTRRTVGEGFARSKDAARLLAGAHRACWPCEVAVFSDFVYRGARILESIVG